MKQDDAKNLIDMLTVFIPLVGTLLSLLITWFTATRIAVMKSQKSVHDAEIALANDQRNLAANGSTTLERVAEALALTIQNQQVNAQNTARLIERSVPLETLFKDHNKASADLAVAIQGQTQTLSAAMLEMRGAQHAIIQGVNDHADENQQAANDQRSAQATTLATLEQKVSAHKAMTEKAYLELIARLDQLPSTVADLLRPEIQGMQSQILQLEAANRELVTDNLKLISENAALKALRTEPVEKHDDKPAGA